ncbi:RecBCD enzyme subunit RecD [Buchnera aphidicola (Periphyllus testudinaceus)]|uniref:exodeoxyribonuclease V subunit alpha n=1 Tax=Buchnera aphidicola TaxID=9 RepID=UPI003464CC96
MLNIMKELLKKKIIKIIDFYFSKTISKKNESLVLIISAYLSLKNRKGHSYISLKKIFRKKFFSKKILSKIKHFNTTKKIKKELLKSNAVSKKKTSCPLILDKHYLYLNKIWKIEKKIFKFLISKYPLNKYILNKFNKILKIKLFKNLNVEQKIAITSCLINKFTFILGGPGTGKTNIVSKIIFLFITMSKYKKITLAASTGKASTVLLESIKNNKLLLKVNKKFKKYIPKKSFTIHRLFQQNNYFENNDIFSKKHKINTNLLIIDESSMIDIFIFENIIKLISNNTQIIFLGDNNQLPSINTGSILNDIFIYYLKKNKNKENYYKFQKCLKKKNIKKIYKKQYLKNKICLLKKKYRFKKKSDIYKFSKIIKNYKKNNIKNIFNNKFKNIKFFIINNKYKKYINIIKKFFLFYKNYWKMILKNKPFKKIIKIFNKIRILCILKKGLYGIKGINKIFVHLIKKNNLTYFKKINNKKWYVGKPIIITKNLNTLKLFNGLIGITLLDKNKNMKVFFLMPNKSIKIIPINLIKKYKTTWAITVHKSQGSEFKKVILIIPSKKNKIMSREIIYTAITRSKKKLLILSKKNIFLQYIEKKIIKKSGLKKRLENY